MTSKRSEPTRVVVGLDTNSLAGLDLGTSLASARVVVLESGGADLSSQQLEDITNALSSAGVIAIGVAEGRVSNDYATILLACDLVIAGPDCVWDDAVRALHLAAAQRLPRALAQSVAELTTPISSAQLFTLGIVTEVDDDPSTKADRLAAELNEVSSGTLSGTKEMIDSALHTSLASALALESALQIPLLMGEEHHRIIQELRGAKPPKSSGS
jgi:enoyl-CoA hydratase/carnithine racemase